jgi:hypothetical protein
MATDLAFHPAPFDYGDLPPADSSKLEQHAAEITRLQMDGLAVLVAQGGHLKKAREIYGNHRNGSYGRWIEAFCPFGRTSAHKRIAVHDAFADIVQRAKQYLPIATEAAYLLSKDDTPEDATARAVALAEAGERITTKRAQEIIAEFKPPTEPDDPDPQRAPVADDPPEDCCSQNGDTSGGSVPVGLADGAGEAFDDDPEPSDVTDDEIDAACEPPGEAVELPPEPTEEDFYAAVKIVEDTITTQYGRVSDERKPEFCSRLHEHLEDIVREF